ncbi:hypothetical protein Acr_24g0006180 [Actinidia rufa]|uniref:Uncharacterized protein n=1 Tax=Actinidia rufa TaxID=165716 RepID=A0A7J0GUG5_9ERIC|nr:hypothetical protein Acr_24g0006180 [Actinidia rufa]
MLFLDQLHLFHGHLSGDRNEVALFGYYLISINGLLTSGGDKFDDLVQCGSLSFHPVQPISINDRIIRGRYVDNNKLYHELLGTSSDFKSYGSQSPVRLSIKTDQGAQAGFMFDFDSLSCLKSCVNVSSKSIPLMSRENDICLVVELIILTFLVPLGIEGLTEIHTRGSSSRRYSLLARCHGFTVASVVQANMGSTLFSISIFLRRLMVMSRLSPPSRSNRPSFYPEAALAALSASASSLAPLSLGVLGAWGVSLWVS